MSGRTMVTIDRLCARWDEEGTKRPLVADMNFVEGWLVLGVGTRLGKVDCGDMSPRERTRLAALLTVAHRRPVGARQLRHLERALNAEHDGDIPLAHVHIALSQLGRLARPQDDARRLFFLNSLIEDGVEPEAILKGFHVDAADSGLSAQKYDPDQPRVPAGSGRPSGQWTRGDSTAAENVTTPIQSTNATGAQVGGAISVGSLSLAAYPGDFRSSGSTGLVPKNRSAMRFRNPPPTQRRYCSA